MIIRNDAVLNRDSLTILNLQALVETSDHSVSDRNVRPPAHENPGPSEIFAIQNRSSHVQHDAVSFNLDDREFRAVVPCSGIETRGADC